MSAGAFQDFKKAGQQLADLTLYLNEDEKKEFKVAQEAWVAFRELEAKSYASRWGRGGTIWPTLNSREALAVTFIRIEELKRELEHLRKNRSYSVNKSD